MPRKTAKTRAKTTNRASSAQAKDTAKAKALAAEMEWAKVELLLETLETRKNDGLDFHEIPVWSIRDLVRHAFETGYQHGSRR
jgi:hypothetical protein